MKKWIVIVVALVGGGWVVVTKFPTIKGLFGSTQNIQQISTTVAEQRDIRFNVSAAGEIGPAEQVSVKPEINGKIDQLAVDLGDHVKKGAILVSLDDKELQNKRSTYLTDIERSKLQLEQADRNFGRAEELFKSGLLPKQDYENTRTDFALAKNSLERAQRELTILEEQLTKTKIIAPFDCTILTRPVSMGQAVSGSGGFNSGTEVLTIADLNAMVINAHINQADITRLKVDQEVEVTLEAVADVRIVGKVERIAPQATIKNATKGFAVRVVLKNLDDKVRPGMTANIKIPVGTADNVVSLPLAAVFTEKNPDTGRPERFVYVATGEKLDTFKRRAIQVGISDFFFAEIQSGLKTGEVVAMEQPKEESDKPTGDTNKPSKPAAGTTPVTPKAAGQTTTNRT